MSFELRPMFKAVGESPLLKRAPNLEEMRLLVERNLEVIRATANRYSKLVRSTDRCDRSLAERAVAKLYEKNHLGAPVFIWFNSPKDGLTAAAFWDVLDYVAGQKTNIAIGRKLFRYSDTQFNFLHMNQALRAVLTESLVYDPYIGSVIWHSIGLANRGLMYEHVAELDHVRAQIMNQLGGHPQHTKALNALAVYLRGLNETSYKAVVTSRQYVHQRLSVLGPVESFDPHELVTPRAVFDLMHEELLSFLGLSTRDGLEEMQDAVNACSWWYPMTEVCLMIDRPVEFHLDERQQLHNEAGLAVSFLDGFGVYCLHGLPVSKAVVERSFCGRDIDNEKNVEVRRVMIERYGANRYLEETGAEEVHQDECGILYRKEQPGDEPLVMLKVCNSTPEPDGTYKSYFLRVPPSIVTAREAVAWTFGLTAGEYDPCVET